MRDDQSGSCPGKQAYASYAQADKVARNQRRFGKGVGVYACTLCRQWHTGRSSFTKNIRP